MKINVIFKFSDLIDSIFKRREDFFNEEICKRFVKFCNLSKRIIKDFEL